MRTLRDSGLRRGRPRQHQRRDQQHAERVARPPDRPGRPGPARLPAGESSSARGRVQRCRRSPEPGTRRRRSRRACRAGGPDAREKPSLRLNSQAPTSAEPVLPSATASASISGWPPSQQGGEYTQCHAGASRRPPSSNAASETPAGSHSGCVRGGGARSAAGPAWRDTRQHSDRGHDGKARAAPGARPCSSGTLSDAAVGRLALCSRVYTARRSPVTGGATFSTSSTWSARRRPSARR